MKNSLLGFFVLFVLISFTNNINAQQPVSPHHRDHDYNNYSKDKDNDYDRTKDLINEVKENLDALESGYLTRLSQRDYVKAKRKLNRIYELLEKIPVQRKPVPPVIYPMPEKDFRDLVTSISNEGFDENKVVVLQSAAKYNNFDVDQVVTLMDQSTFSAWKIKVVEITYPYVIDKYNSFKIINALSFSEDKEKVRQILSKY